MKRDLWSAARLLTFPTAALLAVLAFLPGRLGPAVRIYALVLAFAAILVVLAALRRALPPASSVVRQAKPPAPQQVARLGRLENAAALGIADAFDFHHRLRPRLRNIAAGLLAARRGISLDADPEAARKALGEDTWQLVRHDRPPPEDRLARGITPAALTATVESLERI